MNIILRAPINFYPSPISPEPDAGKEAAVLQITHVSFSAGEVEIDVAATLELPDFVGRRYRRLRESAVLVVNDVENMDGGVLNVRNDFIEYAPEPTDGPNQIEEPELPMPGRGSLEAEVFQEVFASMRVAFPCPSPIPRYRPSIYVYLVVENYVSNVVGLDLVDKKAISFPPKVTP